jgi:hypothetical protein
MHAAAAQAGEENDGALPPPTSEDLSEGIASLLTEVDDVLASDRWAIFDRGSEHVTWLLYDAAALRHCCRLLYEMEVATQTNQELAARLLARAHLEAWLVALYIHYGGFEAVERVAQDTRYSLEVTGKEAKQFDLWLAAEQKSTRQRARKVEQANRGITQWNEENPEARPKALLDPPYVPQLQPTGLDLSDRIAAFGEYDARPLLVSEIVDALSKLGPAKGFGGESFRPLYLIYRVQSAIGPHATLNIFESYLVPGRFIRTAPLLINGSIVDAARITALHGTAFLASAILGEQGSPTPVADEIAAWLMPDPSGRSAWAPGI